MRLAVSDTSPLTGLIHVGRAELLPALFSEVVIPPAVARELLADHLSLPPWLRVAAPVQIPSSVAAAALDDGEAEAIALALELRPDFLLVDEMKGRTVAKSQRLRITGVLGILVLAKTRGLINAVLPIAHELRRKAGCWFSDDLLDEIRRGAGE